MESGNHWRSLLYTIDKRCWTHHIRTSMNFVWNIIRCLHLFECFPKDLPASTGNPILDGEDTLQGRNRRVWLSNNYSEKFNYSCKVWWSSGKVRSNGLAGDLRFTINSKHTSSARGHIALDININMDVQSSLRMDINCGDKDTSGILIKIVLDIIIKKQLFNLEKRYHIPQQKKILQVGKQFRINWTKMICNYVQ